MCVSAHPRQRPFVLFEGLPHAPADKGLKQGLRESECRHQGTAGRGSLR